MLKIIVVLLSLFINLNFLIAEDYPQKTVKLIVYTDPGGLIDISTRKIAKIIESKFSEYPVVVENKKGAGGILAIKALLSKKADGHTFLAITNSVIAKLVSTKNQKLLNEFDYVVKLIDDYEAIIINKNNKDQIKTLDDLKAVKKLLISGPAKYGRDYFFADKLMKSLNKDFTWVSYKSGSAAISALLGGHVHAYIGNPSDINGRPDLEILNIASKNRLPAFPEVKTFKELGFNNLDSEILWRGFVAKKGTDLGLIDKSLELFKKVVNTDEWNRFVKDTQTIKVFQTKADFEKQVRDDEIEFSK